MQTQCPSCQTVFRVQKAQLQQANGVVRCGQCKHTFNGYDELVKNKAVHTPEMLKRMLHGRPDTSPAATLGWSLMLTITTLVLLLQIAYVQRDWLSKQNHIGPLVKSFCEHASWCKLTPYRNIRQIQLVSRNVYSHPNIEKALMVNAVIVNTATIGQGYPTLLISMSNIRGQTVAQRYFKPDEYLPTDKSSETALMEPGKAISINLEIMDPGQDALAFELDFI